MNFLKKYWYMIFVLLLTVGLGVMVFLTSGKLTTTKPVAPTVPQVTPKAAEPACTLTFTIATPTPTPTATPTPTPTPTPNPTCGGSCGSNGQCPTDHTCSGDKCVLSACLQSGVTCSTDKCTRIYPTPTPTPSQVRASCNNTCSVNTDCASGLVCLDSACRNPSCTEKTNCQCDVAAGTTPIPTAPPTPKVPVAGIGPSVLGASVIGGGLLLLLLVLAL
ncbi:MAG: hypothetical protein UY16_C0002G0042 [Candidatus Gottesmanbacteria bacterium GW2011_GWA2_47_9]|uniref:Uncharacterized protein n=1 Tax=Candidatus Gottesmanbacteria bacterium GW2011_GWA2_47_9 TaxID=1618445 RepID=A0A0G1X2X3_9BACT|nr:MAG: hypothetical protein UY16_C0002G0042 [Candidatus Gottesmanbacteria bacterium GW2011_GWA2_47_9]